MMEQTYCWEIYTTDDNIFLGYAYAADESSAINNALNGKGVASQYGKPKEKLRAEKL